MKLSFRAEQPRPESGGPSMQGSERRGFRSPLDRPTRFEAEEIHRRESVGESGSRGVFLSTFETQFRELRGRLHEMKQRNAGILFSILHDCVIDSKVPPIQNPKALIFFDCVCFSIN